MLPEQRKREILSLIKRQGAVSVTELGEMFQITAATVRKDLAELEDRGLVLRSHGGALLPSYGRGRDVPIEQRQSMKALEKDAIAKVALGMIEHGDTVIVDSSSTVFCLARLLAEVSQLTVITNSLNVMHALAGSRGIRLYSLGGTLDHESRSFIGPEVEDNLRQLHVDKAFVSTKGISLEAGLTDAQLHEARIHRRMLAAAKKRFLLMDDSKFDVVCLADAADLGEIDCVITDEEPPYSYCKELESLGVELIIAHT